MSMSSSTAFGTAQANQAFGSSRNQALIGLCLLGLVFGGWLALHLWASFFFKITSSNWLLVLPIFSIQCWLSVGMFIIAHDAMHGSLAPGHPKVNKAIGTFLLFVYAGFGWRKLRDAHFAHHLYVGTSADPDFNADNPHQFWPWYRLFLKRYFGWWSMAYVWTVVLGYFLVLGVPMENIVLLYGLPAIASSIQLFYFGTYRPHRHQSEGFADHHRSRTNHYGVIASLVSCFHFGYHHEHHLLPSVPWWGLPRQHAHWLKTRNTAE